MSLTHPLHIAPRLSTSQPPSNVLRHCVPFAFSEMQTQDEDVLELSPEAQAALGKAHVCV